MFWHSTRIRTDMTASYDNVITVEQAYQEPLLALGVRIGIYDTGQEMCFDE